MKKNRAKIILILLFIAGAIYALYPTYQSQKLKSELDEFGTTGRDSVRRAQWLAQNAEDMKSASTKAIKLGLDLRGGIYVTMEVDVLKFLEEQALQKDDLLDSVLKITEREEATTENPIVPLFVQHFNDIAKPKGKSLANYFYFADANNGDDKSIQAALQKGVDEAVDRAIEIIRNRIDQFGLTEPTIQKQGSRRIIIELPGGQDVNQVHQLLQGTAQLEFRVLKDQKIVERVLERIDKHLAGDTSLAKFVMTDSARKAEAAAAKSDSTKAKAIAAKDTTAKDTSKAAIAGMTPEDSAHRADSLAEIGMTQEQKAARFIKLHPFQYLLARSTPQRAQSFIVNEQDRSSIKQILQRPDVKPIYGDEVAVMFGRPMPSANNTVNYYEVYFLAAQPELTGKVITDARADISQQDGRPEVSMQMDEDGAHVWRRVTKANINKQVAIVLDSVVYSAPKVLGEIPSGNSQITGIGDMTEANLLKIVLKAGALPAPVKIIQESVVGPSLGADSISKGTWSIVWSFIVVIIFMAFYYITGGLVADMAVLINLLFTMAVLATFGATLTLPGMAGLVLTVGIAVDANVLIYERIREELSLGKSLKLAMDDGYHRAFAPIFDGHLTAFFSGVILYAFGTGTVQGFAVTLMIGVAASLFTAIVITRVIFDILMERNQSVIKFG
ncbi:MAG: protein translocase subunit SecD [Bacteroidota bacterium]|nr:protein translocase subunit SecD [Bacteroidota bacterium]MDP4232179.1 protein translocase subunit SecD [Bacteroidota bacterium]MDP4241113.1 protein translocase subunit SecD [Bacteroidota bacterium]MDP4286505.1 protein translocase subunit SecD [Bacteroidota bacterium]